MENENGENGAREQVAAVWLVQGTCTHLGAELRSLVLRLELPSLLQSLLGLVCRARPITIIYRLYQLMRFRRFISSSGLQGRLDLAFSDKPILSEEYAGLMRRNTLLDTISFLSYHIILFCRPAASQPMRDCTTDGQPVRSLH
jgi:hypothetical protein